MGKPPDPKPPPALLVRERLLEWPDLPGTESQQALDSLKLTFPQVSGSSAQVIVIAPEGQSVRTGAERQAILDGVKGFDKIDLVDTVSSPFDSHLKDLNEFSEAGHDVPYGTGISDVAAILRFYTSEKFEGPVSVEYEHNMERSLPEVSSCIGYVRGFLTPKR